MPCQCFVPWGISINLHFSIVYNNGHSIFELCCHEPRPARHSGPLALARTPTAEFRGISISALCLCRTQPGDRCRQRGAELGSMAWHCTARHGTAQHAPLTRPGELPPLLQVMRLTSGTWGRLSAARHLSTSPQHLPVAPVQGTGFAPTQLFCFLAPLRHVGRWFAFTLGGEGADG